MAQQKTPLSPDKVSSFSDSHLTITEMPEDSGRLWRLESPLEYDGIVVHPSFVTDGASIPRWLWTVLPAWGEYSRAAVIHDHLVALIADGRPHPSAPTRRDADAVFYRAMLDSGVGFLSRWTLWVGVRIGALMHNFTGRMEANAPFDSDDQP